MQPNFLHEVRSHWPVELAGHLHFRVGLSGGKDSMVLLDVLHRLQSTQNFYLSAVYVHHGLSPHADEWAQHCQNACLERNIPFDIAHVKVDPQGGESLEAVARTKRYQVYERSKADVIVLAHHADDLSETVLLQALRGAGPRGLAAMPVLRKNMDKWFWRPLLGMTSAQIERYALDHKLTWVHDESNDDTHYRRNAIRHLLMPQIEKTIPSYRHHLARTAHLASDAMAVLDEIAASDLEATALTPDRLHAPSLRALSAPRQRELLRFWWHKLGLPLPSPHALEHFRVGIERQQNELNLKIGSALVFLHRDQIWLIQAPPKKLSPVYFKIGSATSVSFPAWHGTLFIEKHAKGLPLAWLDQPLSLQLRQGGEKLASGQFSRTVKQIFQEASLPLTIRQNWPLLYRQDQLIAIPGLAISHERLEDDGWWPIWSSELPLKTAWTISTPDTEDKR